MEVVQVTFIHPSSVNHRKQRLPDGRATLLVRSRSLHMQRSRQNITIVASGGHAQKLLLTTTRLDPMSYMLFGAFNIKVTERGLECDDWLPVVGNVGALGSNFAIKGGYGSVYVEVFEGINNGQTK